MRSGETDFARENISGGAIIILINVAICAPWCFKYQKKTGGFSFGKYLFLGYSACAREPSTSHLIDDLDILVLSGLRDFYFGCYIVHCSALSLLFLTHSRGMGARSIHNLKFRANTKNISVAADHSGTRVRAMPNAPYPQMQCTLV